MNQEDLTHKLEYIYKGCKELLNLVMKKDYVSSGNIAIFAQSEDEFNILNDLKKQITKVSENPNQKYFELIEPITFKHNDYPSDTFTHLYIRKFDPTDYGKYLGDIDFVCSDEEYKVLREQVQNGLFNGAEIYGRPGWDNIQISSTDYGVLPYLGTLEMAIKARVKFDDVTNL